MRQRVPGISAILIFLWMSGLAPCRADGDDAGSAANWRDTLGAGIADALAANPDIAAMAHTVEAARQRALQAKSLPAPEIELGLRDVPAGAPHQALLSRDDFTMQMFGVRQALPARGRRVSERGLAAAEADEAEAEHLRHVSEVAADVASALADVGEADAGLAALGRARGRLEDAAAIARQLYAAGSGTQAEALRAGLDAAALEDRALALGGARRAAMARFNSLCGRPVNRSVGRLADAAELDQLSTLPVPPLADLLARATQSPDVLVAAAGVRRAEASRRLAGVAGRPEWMLDGYYGRRQRFEDMFGISVSISLPALRGGKIAAGRAAAEAEVAAAADAARGAERVLRLDVERAYANLDQARARWALYQRSILPQAEAAFASTRAAYAGGRMDFAGVERAASDLYLYQLEAAGRAWDVLRAVADLQRSTGVALLANAAAAREPSHAPHQP